jgi:hypothetical protein
VADGHGHELVLDAPRNWREQRWLLDSIAVWTFLGRHGALDEMPARIDVSQSAGPISAFHYIDTPS